MTTFDRYLSRLFLKVLLACFLSLAGLYVVIDTFTNLDEFLTYGREEGNVMSVIADYYSARVPWFFDRASGLLALVAGMFAITWLQRTNELTALMASGVTVKRILRPLLVASVVVSAVAAANRELLIPTLRDRLVRNAQDWKGETARRVESVMDQRSGILIGGRATYANDRRIADPTFTLHRRLGDFGRKITAASAYYQTPSDDHPGGYLFEDVIEPQGHAELASAMVDGAPVILTPHDHAWLKPHQLFIASDVSFAHISGGALWREYASTTELIVGLRNPSLDFGLRTRVMLHSRFVQPFLDITLFVLGLPLVLTRRNRNVFMAIGLCVAVVIGYFGVLIVCQGLGAYGFLLSPALAAWMPLLILAPLAAALSHPLWE